MCVFIFLSIEIFKNFFFHYSLWVDISTGVVGGFTIATSQGALGSRGTYVDYEFMYKGKPASVKYEDIRLGYDRYFIQLEDGGTIEEGKLRSDDGKTVRVFGQGSFEGYNTK